jgi:hypothetical protein
MVVRAAVVMFAVIGCTKVAGPTASGDPDADPGDTCGAGTHDDSGTCVPDGPTAYQIRASSTIAADGHSRNEIRVFGTNADGTPSHDQVVLSMDRPGAGEYVSPTFVLDDLGGETQFIPCNSTIAGCTGPLSLTLALASAPTTPVARVGVMLVSPTDVGSIEHCMGTANVMYLDGDDYIFNGELTVVNAGWGSIGGTERAVIQITPTDPIQGSNWSLDFETLFLQIPMAASVYTDAMRATSATLGHPGLDVNGAGRGCGSITGRFQIHEYTPGTNTDVSSLTASFEQVCDNEEPKLLSGCVHYQQ